MGVSRSRIGSTGSSPNSKYLLAEPIPEKLLFYLVIRSSKNGLRSHVHHCTASRGWKDVGCGLIIAEAEVDERDVEWGGVTDENIIYKK